MIKWIWLSVKTAARALWLVFSIVMWIIMLVIFLQNKEFANWMMWGGICTVCMIPTAIRFIWGSTKTGYRSGARDITGHLNSDGRVTFSDNRYGAALVSFIVSIIVFLVIGPVLLPILCVINAIVIVKDTLRLIFSRRL